MNNAFLRKRIENLMSIITEKTHDEEIKDVKSFRLLDKCLFTYVTWVIRHIQLKI